MEDWLWASAADLGRGIDAGDIDPVALARVHLEAAEAHPLGARIYARLTPDRAMTEAEAAAVRARHGQRRGPLDGVPVSWKDLVDTAGIATEAGTALLEGRVPEADAEVLVTATGNGLVCLGKTHLSEIAFSGLGLNPITATPPNLHDPDAVPGGSSSGAAASLAYGLAAGAIGSDTGGSVRVPAAWNDLVGLKTTHGALSTRGVVALAETFDTIGPLARTVEDAALLHAAIGGPSVDLSGVSLDGARFLVVETVLMTDLEDAPREAFEAAIARLEARGATVERGDWPDLERAFAMAGPVYGADAWSAWGPLVEERGDRMFARILERVSAGKTVLAAEYLSLWRELRTLREAWNAHIAAFDAVLSPTVAIRPPKAEALLADSEHYTASNLMALRNTRAGNLMGGAALTLPTGVPQCGLMFTAGPGTEAALLRLGRAAEQALA
ncbi:amidase [Histidinibacterium lentulum]|uniref:Amidase n=1 Tax=Histidinibacterium lentulum TaxID=2480588 RepID=A0A3N2R6A1_9RHOB|nr:amidase [Histidinibacterium lentulum]ROU02876.1 amidase [Histidinibacterium lentulum]